MAEPTVPFALRESDKHSDTWARMKKHLQERITALHHTLENTEDEKKAAMVRGQLREVRRLLELDKGSPPGS